MNPCIGYITCPHCGNESATVHREKKGKQALYYRCYDGPHGTCGTVQIRNPGGQKFINENMRPLDSEKIEEEATAAAGEVKAAARDVERVKQRKNDVSHVRPGGEGDTKKTGWLDALMGGEE